MNELFRFKHKTKKNQFENHTSAVSMIPFKLIRRQGKTVTLRVSDEGDVVVSAPGHVHLDTIIGFVDKKSTWIYAQQQKTDERIQLPVFSAAEKRRHAKSVHAKATRFLSAYDGKKPKKVFVRYSKTRWGSCSSLGNISLNGYLDLLPDDLFVYVILHELTHLVHMNHSGVFWNDLANHVTDPQSYRKRLEEYKIPSVP